MSAQEGHPHPASTDHRGARAARIERLLSSYGVLTRRALAEECSARLWSGPADFDQTLADLTAARRIRHLGGGLYELARRAEPDHEAPVTSLPRTAA